MFRAHFALILLGLLGLTDPADAKTRSRGEVTVSSRGFVPDDDPTTEDVGLSIDAELELKGRFGSTRQHVRVLGRAGVFDKARSTVILKDAWVGYRNPYVEFRVGAEVLNWTATEAFHPADIINSRNLDGDFENADKLGEPLASARLRFLSGGLTAYVFPMRMAPILPSAQSRLNFGGGAELSGARWVNAGGTVSDERFAAQWALRLDQTIGSADVALHYVDHSDRGQPAILLDLATQAARPVYGRVRRAGLTYTQALGEWLLKVEGDHRLFDSVELAQGQALVVPMPVDHTALAVGLEWGWGYESGSEGTLIIENQSAIAPGASAEERERLGPFQLDGLLGYRHTFNDVASTEFMLGVIADFERAGELLVTASGSRRLGDVWSARVSLRAIRAPDEASTLHNLHDLYSGQLDLTRHF